MSTDVIRRVNKLGISQGQPQVAKNFKYQWGSNDKEVEYDSNSKDDNNDDGDDEAGALNVQEQSPPDIITH